MGEKETSSANVLDRLSERAAERYVEKLLGELQEVQLKLREISRSTQNVFGLDNHITVDELQQILTEQSHFQKYKLSEQRKEILFEKTLDKIISFEDKEKEEKARRWKEDRMGN